MTTPVALERGDDGHVVRFFLPPGETAPPAPLNARVHVRSVPAALMAVRSLPASMESLDGARFVAAAAALLRDARGAGLNPVGAPVQFSYDPPWTPFFMRRNEIAVGVEESSAQR